MKIELHIYNHADEKYLQIQSQLDAIEKIVKESKIIMGKLETRLQAIVAGVEAGNAKADEALALIAELKAKLEESSANDEDVAASEDELTRLEELVGATKVEVPEEPSTEPLPEAPAGEETETSSGEETEE